MLRVFIISFILTMFFSCQTASHRMPASTPVGKTKEYRQVIDNLESARRIGLKKYLESSEGSHAKSVLIDITDLSERLFDLTNDWYNALKPEEKRELMKALMDESRNE